MNRSIRAFLVLCLAAVLALSGCGAAPKQEAETGHVRILATSDLHGKFMPWDYALNAESPSGSMTQLATAIAQYRTDDTLLVDAGDTIQDNAADIFLGRDEAHPMVQALNALRYDVWVPGNHEFNFGMDVTKKAVRDVDATVLAGNVYDASGDSLGAGYAIFDVGGVRVAVIGMVTPLIAHWDAANLAGCTVTDPLDETRKIIDAIAGQYDVLLGVYHMGLDNEYGVSDTGVTDILNACPEFDVMVSAHAHTRIAGEEINGALVVQNKNQAQTLAVIDLTLAKTDGAWQVTEKTSESVDVSAYEPDGDLTALLQPYDDFARADAEKVVGRLEGGPLAPDNEIADIPEAQIRDTALMDLINGVQLYYSGADVAAIALFTPEANLYPGDIRKCDMSLIYKYANTLYTLRMTGAQLKKYMEWSANYYNTFRPGDLTVSFNPEVRAYNYDVFAGVCYQVNVANEPGSRIENLTRPDGTPVQDEDVLLLAANNYRATTHLLAPGEIFDEGDLPELVEMDVRGELGGIRELIGDYIVHVKGGVIHPECDDSWRITGNDWDAAKHQKAVELLRAGKLTIPTSPDGRTANVRSVTEDDLG